MRYIREKDEYQIHITVESKNTSVCDPSVIRDELENASDRIDPCHKSSRSMWPEEELIGISIDESGYFSGKITANKFKISIDSYKDFNRAYDQLKGWLSGSKVKIPQKQSFRITGFTFVSTDDEKVIMYDATKSQSRDETFGYVYRDDGLKANYSGVQGMVTFIVIEPENGLPVSKFDCHIKDILNQDLIVTGDGDKMVDSEEQI